MIRNENEYREAVRQLNEQEARLNQQAAELRKMDLSRSEITRVLDPVRSFHAQLKEEVTSYERLKRGEFNALPMAYDNSGLRSSIHAISCQYHTKIGKCLAFFTLNNVRAESSDL